MQDKDFDQLFKDKLSHAEVEAPAMLWDKIEKEIQPKATKKRILPLYWMAAAVAVMAVTATLVFHTEEKIQLQNSGLVLEKPTVIVDNRSEDTDSQDVDMLLTQKELNVGNVDNSVDNLKSNKNLLAMQPSSEDQHLPIYTDQNDDLSAMPETSVAVETEKVLVPEERTLIASIPAANEKQEALVAEEIQEERRGIRNVGDLVNFVVDKVDKREEKLIQFNTDDDDNSSLIAINIGILKFNKKHKENK